MKPDLESRLRALTWRPAPTAVLDRSLHAALRALPAPLSRTQRVLRFIPAPVRWSLAACWGVSLALHLATPARPPGPPVTHAGTVFDSIQQTNDQIHALQRELHLARR